MVRIGTDPESDYLNGLVPLNKDGYVRANSQIDIKNRLGLLNSLRIGDGAITGLAARWLLQELG